MKNVALSQKMIICFFVLIVLTIAICVGGYYGIAQLNKAYVLLYENVVVGLQYISDASETIQELRSSIQLYVHTPPATPESVALKTDIRGTLDYVYGLIKEYRVAVLSNPDALASGLVPETQIETFLRLELIYDDFFAPTITSLLARADNPLEGDDDADPERELQDFLQHEMSIEMLEILDSATEYYDQRSLESVTQINESSAKIKTLLLISLGVFILASAAIVVYVPLTVAKPIRRIVTVADAIAVGNMEETLPYADRRDEVGKLAAAFERMKAGISSQISILESLAAADLRGDPQLRSAEDTMGKALQTLNENLNRMLWEINDSIAGISAGASHVAKQSQDLAQGTTEQAASVEQLSSAFFEISLNTKESAALAGQAAAVSEEVRMRAVEGTEQMNLMIQAVQDAAAASESIDKIIRVIEEISFQTNILALNAAVEAAHAGQNGSGFAVVAAEVRTLASKSASSAKETSALIANALEKVRLGVKIADKTSESFQKIIAGILESTKMITDIAKFSEEQAMAIEQINTGIGQVSQVIHLNSCAAEECANAADKMSGQVRLMNETLAQFRVKDSGRGPTANARERYEEPYPEKPETPAGFTIDLSPTIPDNDFGKY